MIIPESSFHVVHCATGCFEYKGNGIAPHWFWLHCCQVVQRESQDCRHSNVEDLRLLDSAGTRIANGNWRCQYILQMMRVCHDGSLNPGLLWYRVMDTVLTNSFPAIMLKGTLGILHQSQQQLLHLSTMDGILNHLKAVVPGTTLKWPFVECAVPP